MAAPTFYIETSVWGSLARRQPRDRKQAVLCLLRLLAGQQGTCVISKIVQDEVDAAPPADRETVHKWLEVLQPQILPLTESAHDLARSYLAFKVVPERRLADALHVAVATVYGMDFLVSWNHRHMTGSAKRREFQAVNLRNGYEKTPQIIKPMEACNAAQKKKE